MDSIIWAILGGVLKYKMPPRRIGDGGRGVFCLRATKCQPAYVQKHWSVQKPKITEGMIFDRRLICWLFYFKTDGIMALNFIFLLWACFKHHLKWKCMFCKCVYREIYLLILAGAKQFLFAYWEIVFILLKGEWTIEKILGTNWNLCLTLLTVFAK